MADLPSGQWTPAAEHFVLHQLAHVSNFWKLGLPAEFHLKSQDGGTAELKLSFLLQSPGCPIPPPSCAPNTAPSPSGRVSLKKASQSRFRRRERRAAERAAAAKFAEEITEKASAEKAAEEAATGKAAAEEALVNAEAGKTAAAKQAEEVDISDMIATTSCIGSKVKCCNCNGIMTPSHECEVPVETVSVVEQPPPLPLCHYCCHRGSGEHPVHYYTQCMCNDSDCSCVCYCNDEQLEHKKLFYPGGFHGKGPVAPSDRPAAKSVAEARTAELGKHSQCTASTCVKWWLEDNARCK